MKSLILLALVAMAVARPEGGFYSDKYDNFNVEELIANDKLFKAYARCFNGNGKCTPEGSEIKELIPDAVNSSCAKCSDKQKVLAAKTIKAIQKDLPDEYVVLIKLYDPENKHQDELHEFLAKHAP